MQHNRLKDIVPMGVVGGMVSTKDGNDSTERRNDLLEVKMEVDEDLVPTNRNEDLECRPGSDLAEITEDQELSTYLFSPSDQLELKEENTVECTNNENESVDIKTWSENESVDIRTRSENESVDIRTRSENESVDIRTRSENESVSVKQEESNSGNEFWPVVKEDTHSDGKHLEPGKVTVVKQEFESPLKSGQRKMKNRKVDDDSYSQLKYFCTACGKTIYTSVDMVCINERLRVIVCEACFRTYSKGEFSLDSEGHEMYCSLCGDGGEMFLCDSCEKAMCMVCIGRIAGEDVLESLQENEEEEWQCFCCDPTPIQREQELCKLYRFAKSQEEKQGRRKRNTRRKKMAVLSTSEKKTDVKKKGTSSLTVFKSKEFVSSSDESDDGGNQDKSLIPIPHTETKDVHSGYSSASTVCDMDVTEKNHTTDKDTITILPLANRESSDIKEDLDDAPKRKEDKPVNRDLSPLSLVDQTSDEEIKSDEVSLSDEETPTLASGRKQKKVDQTETSTQSDSQTKRTKKNRLSLRIKSRRIGKSEYGLEQKGNPRVSSSSSDESDKGCLVKRKVSHSEKRRVSRDGERKGHDGGRDVGKKRKMGSNDERESPMIELSSDEMEEVGEDKNKVKKDQNGVTLKKKLHNVTGLLFSSDDERNSDMIMDDNLLSVLSSSEESEMESISIKEDNKAKESSLKDSKSLQYTLNYVSSSDSEQEIFERKPKRKRILSLSDDSTKSNHRSTKTFQFLSDDDFEDIKDHSRRQTNLTYRKKKRRLRKSGFISSGDEESEEEPHNMRTPIKQKFSSNSEDEKDLSTPGKRKNIRKVLPVGKLTNETKEAQKAERERIQRIKKRNKERKEEDGVEAGQIILEDDPKTKEVKLEIRPELVPKILPHQLKGIKFLYNCCCEDLERLNNEPGSGAILAHCMGLGKTLQVIALLDALMLNSDTTNINTVLVLCPVNTLYNWSVEWNKWLPITLRDYHVWIMNDKANSKRVNKLERWSITGGVMIMGYEMFRNLSQLKNIRRKKHKEVLPKYLLDPGPDIIICDEGHVLRQEKSNLSVAVNQVRTRRRIVLTGTPLQNNLEEYFTMVSFVKPNLLGTLKEFRNRFVNPISNGQCSDSQPQDVRQMKQRAHVLHQLLNGCVDRRDYRILAESLPPKYEYVVNIRMSPLQEELIKRYLERNSGYHTATDLFSTFANLLKVWNHPWVLMLDKERKEEERERQLLDVFIDDEEYDDSSLDGFIVKGSDSEDEFRVRKKEETDESSNTSRQSSVSKEVVPINGVSEKPPPSSWYEDLLPEDLANNIELSGKLVFLLELLKEAEKVHEKVLVFSQSLLILNMIEEFIQSPQGGEFIEGINYFRLDGSTKADDRLDFMKRFNNKSSVSSDRLKLFLISTRAGSLGVNLVGANRVVIFDACWNPTHDLQSIFRTYRFGQTKPVFVYRLLAKGTMEEKIYDRQITKQSLSMRVIDEKQIGRHYSFSQLQELFTYTPPAPPDTPPTEPYEQPESDILFCKILEKLRPQHIVGFHVHESLLEHVFDEELSEEERKAAWESYNMQKEMDSRAYNIGIQTQNSFPVAGGGVTPIMQPVMLPAQNQMQATIANHVIQLVQTGVEVAGTVKNLLSLRNSLATVVRNPAQVSARQRYITTYSVLNRKIQDLYTITPQIREVLSTTTVRSSLSPNEQRHLDVLRTKFLQELREVDSKTKVSVPHPAELTEPQFQQPSYIVM